MNTHGGKREGAGRRPTREERRVIKVTLPSALYNRLKKLGGGVWVKRKLIEENSNG